MSGVELKMKSWFCLHCYLKIKDELKINTTAEVASKTISRMVNVKMVLRLLLRDY